MLTQIVPDVRLMCLRFSDAFVHSIIGCLDFAFTYSDHAQLSFEAQINYLCSHFCRT